MKDTLIVVQFKKKLQNKWVSFKTSHLYLRLKIRQFTESQQNKNDQKITIFFCILDFMCNVLIVYYRCRMILWFLVLRFHLFSFIFSSSVIHPNYIKMQRWTYVCLLLMGFQVATDVSVRGLKYRVSSRSSTVNPRPCDAFFPTNSIGNASFSAGGPFVRTEVLIL